MSYLGRVLANHSFTYEYCARLAMLKGFDHYVWTKEGHCYSSYALPANIYKLKDDKGKRHLVSMDYREFFRPHFMKGMSKLSKLWPSDLGST